MNDNSMRKIKITYLLTVIAFLVILVAVDIGVSRHNEKQLSNQIVGSYETQNTMNDTVYLVFTDQKKYTLYKQFKILEKGTYETENTNNSRIYSLRHNNKVSGNAILYGNTIYYIAKDSTDVIEMTKFSDVPNYVNVNVNSNE